MAYRTANVTADAAGRIGIFPLDVLRSLDDVFASSIRKLSNASVSGQETRACDRKGACSKSKVTLLNRRDPRPAVPSRDRDAPFYSVFHPRLARKDFSSCVLSQRLQTIEQLLWIEAIYSMLSSIVAYMSTSGNDNYV